MNAWFALTTEQPSLVMYSFVRPIFMPLSTTEWVTGKLMRVFCSNNDRENCFETTLVHLTERFNGKEVYLVGTMNQSTMLAQRTKKLIEEIKPDAVLVQATEK
jgi:hypothetical protein